MAERKLILITGRSTHQGVGISSGKGLEEYQAATTVLQLNAADMERFGFKNEDIVRLKTSFGSATVKCNSADLPEGLAFIAFGPTINQLVGGDTQSSGMPDSKGFEIELELVSD
ncbi:MAG TPA: molybdopterin dinucleotide binding domain-containing protein [Anaerolineaceae bacterium]|nr:molybdopterin dinucleotide binding domain-containing protein [Anaerolineaceae bacterium]